MGIEQIGRCGIEHDKKQGYRKSCQFFLLSIIVNLLNVECDVSNWLNKISTYVILRNFCLWISYWYRLLIWGSCHLARKQDRLRIFRVLIRESMRILLAFNELSVTVPLQFLIKFKCRINFYKKLLAFRPVLALRF